MNARSNAKGVQTSTRPSGVVTLLTDFGTLDPYVGIMHGVILRIAPQSRLVDLTHRVAPQSVRGGALLLRNAVEYFPVGTVHLAVVDPGVGSARAPIAVATDAGWLVGPDNGLLAGAAEVLGFREARRIENERLLLTPVSNTFHGRDVFAPIAGFLAGGGAFDEVGAPVDEILSLEPSLVSDDGSVVTGEIVHVDHFGNLISNIPSKSIEAATSIEIAGRTLTGLASSYASAAPGAVLAIVGSWGTLEVACNGGSAAETLGCGVGAPVSVRRV